MVETTGWQRRLALDGLWPVRLPWVMAQDWDHLLYLHYRVSAEQISRLLPAELEVEQYDGSAWLSVIPLRIAQVHLRNMVPIPGTADFDELNVRTYVTHRGIPGVYFLSIDASSRLASALARSSFNLPYHTSTMAFESIGGDYHAVSTRADDPAVRFEAHYRPTGRPVSGAPAALTLALAERYCLYTTGRRGRLLRGDISHLPWTVQEVEATVECNDLLAANGVDVLDPEPSMAYSEGSVSRCWPVRSARVLARIWPRT
jgi:uncharacterized protein YqjF (DUF2071 family)